MARARQNWNGSKNFYKETANFYPFRDGSKGAYGPVAERIKVHCFFAKTVGTVTVFVGPVPFLLCRVNAPYIWRQAKTSTKHFKDNLNKRRLKSNFRGLINTFLLIC